MRFQTQSLTSKVICAMESGVSQSLVRAQDLVQSSCGEFNLFVKENVRAARKVLREKGSVLGKN